jgi:hypothetical protein
MQPNPETPHTQTAGDEIPERVLEILDNAAPAELHAAAWAECAGKRWYFGHGSKPGDWSRFWKMDLDGDAVFNALWEHVRPRCEALAGASLRVIRQYANGHTYGLGGNPHFDDTRPDTFTLLYYPNPEWKDGWDGETVFYDASGEIAFSVRPRPNRAVFFDSRIPHAGRAPSRLCPALRVTVAYKLEVGSPLPGPTEPRASASGLTEPRASASGLEKSPGEPVDSKEITRDGAKRVYSVRVPSEVVDRAVQAHLADLGKSVRLPGFRQGKIPQEVLIQRYGAKARSDTLNRLAAEATGRVAPKGSVASSVALKAGAESGDLEFEVAVTYLPDLPSPDFSQVILRRLTAAEADLQAVGLTADAAAGLLRDHLKSQVLDILDAAYTIPLLPLLVERELAAIWKAAESQVGIPASVAAKEAMAAKFRTIAGRRLRLGLVVGEMARRYEIRSQHSAELEDKVIDHWIAQTRVEERQATQEELRELMKD